MSCGQPLATLRLAAPEDRELVFEIHQDSVATQCGAHYSQDDLASWFVGRTADNYLPALRGGAVWIAELDGVAAGFTEVFPGRITMLFVRGGFAGSGIGSQLLTFAVAKASDASRVVRLEATLNAEGFYARRGFVKVGDGAMQRRDGRTLRTTLMERREP